MASEKSIQKRITEYLKKLPRCWYVKNVATIHSLKGLPDLFIIKDGLFYAFEVKTAVGKPTDIQKAVMKKMLDAGALVAVVRSLEEVQTIFKADRRKTMYVGVDIASDDGDSTVVTAFNFASEVPIMTDTINVDIGHAVGILDRCASRVESEAVVTFFKKEEDQ